MHKKITVRPSTFISKHWLYLQPFLRHYLVPASLRVNVAPGGSACLNVRHRANLTCKFMIVTAAPPAMREQARLLYCKHRYMPLAHLATQQDITWPVLDHC